MKNVQFYKDKTTKQFYLDHEARESVFEIMAVNSEGGFEASLVEVTKEGFIERTPHVSPTVIEFFDFDYVGSGQLSQQEAIRLVFNYLHHLDNKEKQ